MVTFVGLALIVAGVVALVVVAVLATPLVTGGPEGRRCPNCHAAIPEDADGCSVCEAPFDTGASTGSEDSDRETERRVRVEVGEEDEDGQVVNPGVPAGLVKVALFVMFAGIAVRVLGMLDPAGLDLGIPTTLTAVLTVIGGLAMFAGFVVLDVA